MNHHSQRVKISTQHTRDALGKHTNTVIYTHTQHTEMNFVTHTYNLAARVKEVQQV